ncbi:hypothetical protein FGIG_04897 [Fasciola gigantica]|uniref:Uncharacterized protein n=1 Tax=Fasciola gigantica TaxID=46835 RepID=A0A504YRC1_FASGI|nr:hypothetical protein FGIG_04897 [Fasciola gigantica]
MDSQEARKVLDRILAELKNKTRRAKEQAAAAAAAPSGLACTGGDPSPISHRTIYELNMVGFMSVQNSGYGNWSSDHRTAVSPARVCHHRINAFMHQVGCWSLQPATL